MHSPGVEVRPLRQITGEAEFNEIFFTDVEVPVENVLGEVGDGWAVAMTTLLHERGTLGFALSGALEVAVAQAARARPRARPRRPRLRDRIAREWIELQALKLTNYRALTQLVETGMPGPEGSVSKLHWSEANQRLDKLALELLGPEAQLDGRRRLLAVPAAPQPRQHDRGRHVGDPPQHHRRARARPARGAADATSRSPTSRRQLRRGAALLDERYPPSASPSSPTRRGLGSGVVGGARRARLARRVGAGGGRAAPGSASSRRRCCSRSSAARSTRGRTSRRSRSRCRSCRPRSSARRRAARRAGRRTVDGARPRPRARRPRARRARRQLVACRPRARRWRRWTRRAGSAGCAAGDAEIGDASAIDRMRTRAFAALALEAVGIAQRALELARRAREDARAVRQADRRLPGRLALARRQRTCATELARSLAYWAAWCVAEDDEQAPTSRPPRRRRTRPRPPSPRASARSRCTAASASPGSTRCTATTSGRSGSRRFGGFPAAQRAEVAAASSSAERLGPRHRRVVGDRRRVREAARARAAGSVLAGVRDAGRRADGDDRAAPRRHRRRSIAAAAASVEPARRARQQRGHRDRRAARGPAARRAPPPARGERRRPARRHAGVPAGAAGGAGAAS